LKSNSTKFNLMKQNRFTGGKKGSHGTSRALLGDC